MTKFSPIQPGIRKYAMECLLECWPDWDRQTLNADQPWPGRDVVVVELLRALRDAGLVNGVYRSDYEGQS